MITRNGLLVSAAVVGLLSTFCLNASAQAPAKTSECKGLAESACKAKTAECAWIAPKAGKQKPYCRAKPAKKK